MILFHATPANSIQFETFSVEHLDHLRSIQLWRFHCALQAAMYRSLRVHMVQPSVHLLHGCGKKSERLTEPWTCLVSSLQVRFWVSIRFYVKPRRGAHISKLTYNSSSPCLCRQHILPPAKCPSAHSTQQSDTKLYSQKTHTMLIPFNWLRLCPKKRTILSKLQRIGQCFALYRNCSQWWSVVRSAGATLQKGTVEGFHTPLVIRVNVCVCVFLCAPSRPKHLPDNPTIKPMCGKKQQSDLNNL